MLRRCISATFDHGYLKECEWLKERYTWKPSDEQMNALYNARCILKPNYNHADIASTLETLYNDLKKLKG